MAARINRIVMIWWLFMNLRFESDADGAAGEKRRFSTSNSADFETKQNLPWSKTNDYEMFSDDPESKTDDGKLWSDYLNSLFDPVFDPEASFNVSTAVGQTAHLPCRVNNLGTKTVSWIRHRDTHILTVGSFPYTGDKRFSALHREGTNEWTLQLTNPTSEDSGLYECQVSTKPVRAYLVNLEVLLPSATIIHAPELHTEEGGVLNLTCVVSPSPTPLEYIFWYHKGEVINYEKDKRVKVSVSQGSRKTVSTLIVFPASMNHSGLYTCEPSNTESTQITVHLFKAEEPAAMQTSEASPLFPSFFLRFYSILLLYSSCFYFPLINVVGLGIDNRESA